MRQRYDKFQDFETYHHGENEIVYVAVVFHAQFIQTIANKLDKSDR